MRGQVEKFGSDSGGGGKRLLDFLSRTDGGCCLNKKNRGRRNAISIYIPVTNSFAPEQAFSVTKFLTNTSRNRVLSWISPWVEICPKFFNFSRHLFPLQKRGSNSGLTFRSPQLFSAKMIIEKIMKNSDAKLQSPQCIPHRYCRIL